MTRCEKENKHNTSVPQVPAAVLHHWCNYSTFNCMFSVAVNSSRSSHFLQHFCCARFRLWNKQATRTIWCHLRSFSHQEERAGQDDVWRRKVSLERVGLFWSYRESLKTPLWKCALHIPAAEENFWEPLVAAGPVVITVASTTTSKRHRGQS